MSEVFNTEQYAEDFFIQNPKGVFVVVGPTASGKTGLAIKIAKFLEKSKNLNTSAEIINCDSRQVYTDLPITVAAPTEEEKSGISHHLFEYLSPEKTQNVSEWREAAEQKILEIQSRGGLVILCGGTGLFVNSLSKNFSLSVPPNEKFRAKMSEFSGEELWEMLEEKDGEEAKKLSPNNKKYVLRALEIFEEKGKKSKVMIQQEPKFKFCFVGITHPRQKLYERINRRNDLMIEAGFLEEVQKFLEKYPNIPEQDGAFIAHGIPEAMDYLSAQNSEKNSDEELRLMLENMKNKMKQHTRNYAKRQLTWWRKDERVRWVSGETGEDISLTDEGI